MTSNQHIQEEKLIGYIYRTIHDADREIIDDHLVDCQICRTRLTTHQVFQRKIDAELRAEINGLTPPSRMNFTAIAPRLQRRGIRFAFPGFSIAVPVTLTLVGLVLAVTGLWQMVSSFSIYQPASQVGALPALACFCLMFVSMEQFDRSHSLRSRFIVSVILAALLWLGTAVLGFLNILVVRDIVLILFIDAGRSVAEAGSVAILAIITAAIAFIIMVIGGAEFHYRRIGQPSSWKVFLGTIILQLLVLITPYFLW
jgi:predicted anti-sigma-YlaC factor YlaD